MVASPRNYSVRHLVSARAAVAVVLCASALLFVWQQLGASIDLQHLRFQRCATSQCPDAVASSESAYRQRLNVIRPLDTVPHSKTLGVAGRLYVIHLPFRADRHEAMSKLERAMDIEFTWHNATDYHSETVGDILERLRWWRNAHRVNASAPMADPSPFKFEWADDIGERSGPLGLSGADLWSDSFGESPLPPLPAPPSPDRRPPNLDSREEDGRTFGGLTILPAQVACWHSHYEVLRRIAEGAEDVAVIFEDDIDMEWDLERRLRGMWDALPADWDMVMLGHCLSAEWTHPALDRAPALHPAFRTLCTHAYAVTRRAAQHLVRRLRSEAFAYSRNVDIAVYHLLSHDELRIFSVFPPVVVQDQATESDIVKHRPQKLQPLADSALERIRLAEAEDDAAAAAAGAGLDDSLGETEMPESGV